MKLLDLFSGIGGFSLAAHWLGWETIGFVEKDRFCQKVLRKNFNSSIPLVEDIRDVTNESFQRPDVISGGFPCQPFSVAGKRLGRDDDRYLWDETLRVVSLCKPRWFVGENVAGIVSMELDNVLADLESEGYETQTFVIPACAVGAPHRRDRVWIIANADGRRCRSKRQLASVEGVHKKGKDEPMQIAQSNSFFPADADRSGCKSGRESQCADSYGTRTWHQFSRKNTTTITHANSAGSQGSDERSDSKKQSETGFGLRNRDAWREPVLQVVARTCRVDDGLPRRVDRTKRLKALGNSIVPQVAYEIFKAINFVENQPKY